MQIAPLSPDFAVGPQIRPSQLAEIAAQGFRAIVNNRPDNEELGQPADAEIAAEAARLGLAYRFVPVGEGYAVEPAVQELRAFLAEADGPIFAFCRTGNRSARLWALATGAR